MFNYYIAFIFTERNGISGYGAAQRKGDKKITFDDVMQIAENIKKECSYEMVIVTNFILLEE